MSTWPEAARPENMAQLSVLLLNGCVFRIRDIYWRLAEIEFYYYSPNHQDEYVHNDPLQSTFGQIYFHKNGRGYRGGNYKGMDMTFGTPDYRFSVLIRSLQNLTTGEIITGPCNVVNRILKDLNFASIIDLMTAYSGIISFLSIDSPLSLLPLTGILPDPVYYGARIGLSDKYPPFKSLPYRFVSQPGLKAKIKSKTQLKLFYSQIIS